MNTLRTLWDKGLQLHEELELVFENSNLISYEVKPERVKETYTREVVENLVKELRELKMITFWDKVPKLNVSVPIWEIGVDSVEGNEEEPLFIETFHFNGNNDDNEVIWDDDCNVPVPLHEFLELEMEVNRSHF
jgi:hypothetical protein